MSKNKPRLTSFQSLMLTQFFGAFNDNVFQIVVALLIVRWVQNPIVKNQLVTASGVLFAVPFLLFSLVAGRMADRWSKARIILWVKTCDVLVVSFALLGMYLKNIPVMMAGLFLLAAQSAFFGPSKYGILPELKKENELSHANGLLNMATFVAILAGTIAGTFLIGNINAIALTMGLMAVGSWLFAFHIEKTPAANPSQALAWNPIPDFVRNWRMMAGVTGLRLTMIGVCGFWFLGAVLHLNILVYVNDVMHLPAHISGMLLTGLVIGVALGSVLAGKFSNEHVKLGLVPYGALGSSLFTLDLYFSHGLLARTVADTFLLGLSSGFYVIPLSTWIQVRSPASERGRVLATSNFLSFVAIALGSLFLWVLGSLLKVGPAAVFLVLGSCSLTTTLVVTYLLSKSRTR